MKALSIIGIVLTPIAAFLSAVAIDINNNDDRAGVLLFVILILLYALALSIVACVNAFKKKKQ